MATQQFLGQVEQLAKQAQNGSDVSDGFSALFQLDLAQQQVSQRIGSLQNDLVNTTDAQLAELVESRNLFDGDWGAFELLLVSYLRLCRDIDPWSVLSSHDLILSFFNNLATALTNNMYGNNLAPVMYDTVRYMVPLVKRVDVVLNASVKGKKFKRLTFVSTVLSKLFNQIRSSRGNSKKKLLILFIVNTLNKIYFIIGSPLLCDNIFANVNLLDHKFSQYPKEQQVEYRYILGRLYILKNRLTLAFKHLNWAFSHAPRSDTEKITKILRYLIPVGILVGKVPSKRVISQYPEFTQMYRPLIIHFLNGNLLGYEAHLFQNQSYFKSKSLLILLAQRGRILVLRNLLVKVQQYNPTPTRLYYSQIQPALRKSIGTPEQQNAFGTQHLYKTLDEPVDEAFIENVLSTLKENRLIKGAVLQHAHFVLLAKTNAFPDVYEVYSANYGKSDREAWMDR